MDIPLNLTIAIPVLNEEKNLSGCLEAIGKNFCSQVVIIDSGSTDDTRQIAEKYGAAFVEFKWNGHFPKKRNWFLRNHPPVTEWVLFLDADEYLTPAFKMEMQQVLPTTFFEGFWLNYSIYFMGKKLKGGYPLQKLALFKVGAGEYEKIDEDQWSRLDMEVHEHPVLSGPFGKIKSKIDHQDFRGVSHYMAKHNEYAAWEAARFLATNQMSHRSQWTFKQKLKYKLMTSVLVGPVYFFGSFFLLGGFRDGARGFAFSILKMSYFTNIYCKIKETGQPTQG